ncbi:MAG: hypothetical protein IPM52_00030 [Bacteroidetes bacterium]|nr:hypothetical protein [Bacteroidota bacterium]
MGNTSSDNGWKFVEASNTSSPFNFTIDYTILNGGSVSVGDIIQYFVVAQDMAPTPNVGINTGTFATAPSSVALVSGNFPIGGTINSFNIVASISGTVTVGTGGTYPSLTGAGGLFADINAKVVSGNIIAEILDNLTEDGTNALNQFNESGGPWTLTIRPADASTKTISGSYAGGLIRLNGADRVTFDGRFSGSGTWLTFQNTSTSSSAVFMLMSLGTGQGATNNTIRNCNIIAGSNSATTYGIHIGSNTLGTGGADNDDNTIRENNISKARIGIWVQGSATSNPGLIDNLNIIGNSVGSNVTADQIGFYGIELGNVSNADVSQNTVFNIIGATSNPVGIQVGSGVINSLFSRNNINSIQYIGSGGYGARGMVFATANSSSNNTIVNNVIYNILADGDNSLETYLPAGIWLQSGGGYNLYYNSVNMYGTVTVGIYTSLNAALYISSGVANLDIRNNIFVNTINKTSYTNTSYSIYSVPTSISTINYNDYYGSGSQYVLGYLSSNQTTLSAWQTATSQDANSISTDPLFASATNLAPQAGSPVLFAGTPITGITTDIDGVERSSTNPSIGAYELENGNTGKWIVYGAADNASNYSTWTHGSNQGDGFGAWSITTGGGGSAGAFLGDPFANAGISGMSNPSFALFANPGGSGAFVNADRSLIIPLPDGATLSFDYGTNWDTDTPSGNKGFNLYTGGISGTQIININQSNSATITINSNDMFTAYGTNKITFNFEQISATQLRVYATGRDGVQTFDQTLTVAGRVDAIRFYASGLNDNNANREPYFNNFKIVTTLSTPATKTADIRGKVLIESPTTYGNVLIPSGHSLQINPTQSLTTNHLVNNAGSAGVLIRSTSAGTGSLLHNTNNVPAKIERYITGNTMLTGTYDYHLVSVPLNAGVTAAQFLGSYLYEFNTSTQSWAGLGSSTSTPLPNDRGYMIFYPNTSTTYTFTGQLNNGSFTASTPLTAADQFALVPNPYPSALDWDASSGWTKTNLQNAIWIWNPVMDQYASYIGGVGANGGTQYIPVGQAFFVKSNAASPVLGMNNGVRVHNNSPFFKHSGQLPNLLRIHAQGNNRQDEIVLHLRQGSLTTKDEFDGDKLYGAPVAPQLYFILPDGRELAINNIPPDAPPISLPVGFKLQAEAQVNLSFEGLETFGNELHFVLEDLLTGSLVNLRENPTYAFVHNPANNAQRFVLHLTSVTAAPDAPALAQARFWMHGNDICIALPDVQQPVTFELFDALGRHLGSYRRDAAPLIRIPAPKAAAVIIRATTGNKVYSSKVFTR